MIDIAIVGAGPAGLSAAIYASRAGFSAVAFEELVAGGQLTSIDRLENYPGFAEGIGGFDISPVPACTGRALRRPDRFREGERAARFRRRRRAVRHRDQCGIPRGSKRRYRDGREAPAFAD